MDQNSHLVVSWSTTLSHDVDSIDDIVSKRTVWIPNRGTNDSRFRQITLRYHLKMGATFARRA